MDERTQLRISAIKTEWPEAYQAIFEAGQRAGIQVGEDPPAAVPPAGNAMPTGPAVGAAGPGAGLDKEARRKAAIAAGAAAANGRRLPNDGNKGAAVQGKPGPSSLSSNSLISQAVVAGNKEASKRQANSKR